eukprot:3933803-Rhodomonas_salina.1
MTQTSRSLVMSGPFHRQLEGECRVPPLRVTLAGLHRLNHAELVRVQGSAALHPVRRIGPGVKGVVGVLKQHRLLFRAHRGSGSTEGVLRLPLPLCDGRALPVALRVDDVARCRREFCAAVCAVGSVGG